MSRDCTTRAAAAAQLRRHNAAAAVHASHCCVTSVVAPTASRKGRPQQCAAGTTKAVLPATATSADATAKCRAPATSDAQTARQRRPPCLACRQRTLEARLEASRRVARGVRVCSPLARREVARSALLLALRIVHPRRPQPARQHATSPREISAHSTIASFTRTALPVGPLITRRRRNGCCARSNSNSLHR